MLGAVVAVIAGLGLFPAQATQQSLPTANIVIVQNRDHYPAGDTYPIDFEITIARDWNIHGPRKSEEGLIPTRLAFDPVPGIAVIDLAFPDPEMVKFDYAIDPVAVYDGTILVKARLRISADHPEGIAPLAGRLSFQACSATLCRPPESVAFNFLITIGAPDAVAKGLNVNSDVDAGTDGSVAGEKSQFAFWLTLAGIFLGGLALNLTPCIYPLIPVTISYFGSKSENIQGRTVLHAAIYLAGLSLTNAALGVSAALSGAMLGAVLQHPLVLILLAAVLMALALSMFGLWDLNAPGLLARFVSRNPAGYWGTFFMGLTLGIVAAPCIGPFILGLLTYVGQTGNPLLGFVYFLVLSIGMGLPLCILAAFSGSVRRLPRSGQWMMWVKKAMGWIMVGMAAYLVRPLLPASFAKDPLIFLVMIAAGIHLGFMEKTDVQLRKFNIAKKNYGHHLRAGRHPFMGCGRRPGGWPQLGTLYPGSRGRGKDGRFAGDAGFLCRLVSALQGTRPPDFQRQAGESPGRAV